MGGVGDARTSWLFPRFLLEVTFIPAIIFLTLLALSTNSSYPARIWSSKKKKYQWASICSHINNGIRECRLDKQGQRQNILT